MNLYIYSDESGTFDSKHNDYFVFGGLLMLGQEQKDNCSRKYSHVEQIIRERTNRQGELKGCNLRPHLKKSLFRSLNTYHKFAIIVKQKEIDQNIFNDGRHMQRFLDYIYKVGVKNLIKDLIERKMINPDDIEEICVFCDEHNTATDAVYELREGLYNEFKIGTFNSKYDVFYPPILPHLHAIDVKYCNSKKVILVRAADIIANRILNLCRTSQIFNAILPNFVCYYFPYIH